MEKRRGEERRGTSLAVETEHTGHQQAAQGSAPARQPWCPPTAAYWTSPPLLPEAACLLPERGGA